MKETRAASTVIVQDNKFLLVKARRGMAKGLWNNPGGRLEKGESFEEAAVRETLEETGFQAKLDRLVNTYQFQKSPDHHIVKKVFSTTITGGSLRIPKDEIEEAKWFSLEEIKNEQEFTFGAVQSIRDFQLKIFDKEYFCHRVP